MQAYAQVFAVALLNASLQLQTLGLASIAQQKILFLANLAYLLYNHLQ